MRWKPLFLVAAIVHWCCPDHAFAAKKKAAPVEDRSEFQDLYVEADSAIYYKNYDMAVEIYERMLPLCRDVDSRVETTVRLGLCLDLIGRKDDAEKLLRKARVDVLKSKQEFMHGYVLHNLGTHLMNRDREEEGEPILQEALQIRRKLGRTLETAYTLTSLGASAKNLGAYNKAYSYYAEALVTFDQSAVKEGAEATITGEMTFSGPYAPQTVDAMTRVVSTLSKIEQHDLALKVSQRYYDLFEERFGPESLLGKMSKLVDKTSHPQMVSMKAFHGKALKMVQQPTNALTVLTEALEEMKKIEDSDYPQIDTRLDTCDVGIELNDFVRVEEHLKWLERAAKSYGPFLEDAVRSRRMRICLKRGDIPGAEQIVKDRMEFYTTTTEIDDEQWFDFLNDAFEVFAKASKSELGRDLQKKYLDLKLEMLRRTLRWTSQSERLAFVASKNPLSTICATGSPLDIATATLQWKAVVLRSNVEEKRSNALLRAADGKLAAELTTARGRARELALKMSMSQTAEDATVYRLAQENVERLEKRLHRNLRGTTVASYECLNAKWQDVCGNIPDGSVFLDFVKFKSLVSSKPHYGVLIEANNLQVEWFDLGEAETIEAELDRFRSEIERAPKNPAERESQEANLRTACEQLYRQTFGAISARLREFKRIYICPDAQLHFAPFSVFLDEENRLAAENWDIALVTHGSVFLEKAGPAAKTKRDAVVIGSPEYNYKVSKKGATKRTRANTNTAAVEATRNAVKKIGGDEEWGDLTGAKGEAVDVKEILEENGLGNISFGVGGAVQCSEDWLRSRAGASLIHIATHGFSASEKAATLDSDSLLERAARADAMLGCGIVLRGGQHARNMWGAGGAIEQSADGILFASEVIEMALDKTELVFLSCCDSGLGMSNECEGVLGLRRAFEAAGVQNIVTTLWRMPDNSPLARRFVREFYQHVGNSGSIQEAFWQTQRALMSFAKKGRAHSFTELVNALGIFSINVKHPPSAPVTSATDPGKIH